MRHGMQAWLHFVRKFASCRFLTSSRTDCRRWPHGRESSDSCRSTAPKFTTTAGCWSWENQHLVAEATKCTETHRLQATKQTCLEQLTVSALLESSVTALGAATEDSEAERRSASSAGNFSDSWHWNIPTNRCDEQCPGQRRVGTNAGRTGRNLYSGMRIVMQLNTLHRPDLAQGHECNPRHSPFEVGNPPGTPAAGDQSASSTGQNP